MYVLACETLLDSRCRCMELSRPGIVHATSLPSSMPLNARMRLRLRAACCTPRYLKRVSYYPFSSPKGSGSNGIGKARGVGVGRGGGERHKKRSRWCSPLCWNGPSKGKARRAFQSQPIGQSLLQAVVDATSLVLKPGISREPGLCGTSALSDCSCWCA